MEPIAVGFMVLVGTAALLGVVVGAIGGAVAWASVSARWLRAPLLAALGAGVCLILLLIRGRRLQH
jgi:hypothetical protein